VSDQHHSVEVFSRGSRTLGASVLVIAIVATLGGMVDPAPGGDRHALLPGLGFSAVELVLLLRALRLGLTISDETVTSRGWFRTRTFPRGAINDVGTSGYSGSYNRYSTSGRFLMLTIEVDSDRIPLPHVAGSAARVHGLADHLRAALALWEREERRKLT
jgi:hypothetical protein